MTIEKVVRNNIACAVIHSEDKVITDTSSALDLLMSAKYEVGTKNIAISKSLICDDFFILSCRIHMRLPHIRYFIVADFYFTSPTSL